MQQELGASRQAAGESIRSFAGRAIGSCEEATGGHTRTGRTLSDARSADGTTSESSRKVSPPDRFSKHGGWRSRKPSPPPEVVDDAIEGVVEEELEPSPKSEARRWKRETEVLRKENKRLSKRVTAAGALSMEVDSMIRHFEEEEEVQSRLLASTEAQAVVDQNNFSRESFALEQTVLAVEGTLAEERERCRSFEVELNAQTSSRDEASSMTRVVLAAEGAAADEFVLCRTLETELDAEHNVAEVARLAEKLQAEVVVTAEEAALGAEAVAEHETERSRRLEQELDNELCQARRLHSMSGAACREPEATALDEVVSLRAELKRLQDELANSEHRPYMDSVGRHEALEGENAEIRSSALDAATQRWGRLTVLLERAVFDEVHQALLAVSGEYKIFSPRDGNLVRTKSVALSVSSNVATCQLAMPVAVAELAGICKSTTNHVRETSLVNVAVRQLTRRLKALTEREQFVATQLEARTLALPISGGADSLTFPDPGMPRVVAAKSGMGQCANVDGIESPETVGTDYDCNSEKVAWRWLKLLTLSELRALTKCCNGAAAYQPVWGVEGGLWKWARIVVLAERSCSDMRYIDSMRAMATRAVAMSFSFKAAAAQAQRREELQRIHALTMHQLMHDDLQRRLAHSSRIGSRSETFRALQETLITGSRAHIDRSCALLGTKVPVAAVEKSVAAPSPPLAAPAVVAEPFPCLDGLDCQCAGTPMF